MREEEKSIVKLLNLDCGLFYTNRRFTLSNPIFDDGELKLEKCSDDLLVYKPNKNDENSLEAWGIFEQTFSTFNIQSSKPQRKTFNLSENDIGLLIPILMIEYCGKPNVTFQSIINMASQSNEPDFLWIGEFFAKKVLVGGTLVIKDGFRCSYNSLEQLKSLIIKSINKFRYASKNLSKEIIDLKQLYIHIEDFDGNLLKNNEMLDTYIQQLYEFKKATVITYEEVIPTYIFLDAEKQPKCFNKRLVPGISTYHEECSMNVWIGIQQLIRERKLEHGLITKSNEFISSLYPAVKLKFDPSIKLLNTSTKFNISHLSTQKELFYITSRIDIFNNKFNLLDNMPFVTVNNNSQINSLHCGIICEKIEMDIKDVIKPSQQLEIEVEEALEKNNPYKGLEKVFAKYGHVFCIKFSMGGILTKLNEFSLTESEIKNVSNNKYEDIESHQETLNAWINLLDQFKMDKNMYIIEKGLSHVRNDYNTIVVSNDKNDNIDDWAKSVSKNLDAWQIVNRQQFIPLYKLFNNNLQKEIESLLSNEHRILMTGISKLKNNEIRYYYEKFNQPLESDEYQVIGSVVSDGLEDVNLIVSFQMLTVSGFSIIIEELDNKSSMKPIADDLKVYWQLIGNPLSVKYFSKNNRNIRVITGSTPNIMLTQENQRINLGITKENFTSNCIIATSFEFSPINFRPKLEVTLKSWSNKCINLNIINHSSKEINKYLENELLGPEKINCNLIWYVIYTTQKKTITDDELHKIHWKYLGQYLNQDIQECLDVEKDKHKAFIYSKKSADMGDASGIFIVGYCYQNGIGVEKDEIKAFCYYVTSANMGDATAMCNLGYFYRHGIGVEKDEHKAFIYYQKSANMGDASGIFNVGYCYQHGIVVEKDEHMAFFYYQKSANMGDAIGAFNVGYCYQNGIGVEKDEHKAFECFLNLANIHHINGIFQIARCYRNGIGVDRNIQKANYWYQKFNESITIKYKYASEQFDIDEDLKKMLIENKFRLPWIPYDEFEDIIEIGKGGFAIVYGARWFDKSRNLLTNIALKKLKSNNRKEFIEELRIYCENRYVYPSFLKCYGISKDNKGNYVLVLEYARKNSLSNNLYEVSQMDWKKKLKLLQCITFDLDMIHFKGFIHKDLHSGNILQDDIDNAYVSDLGLTTSMENKLDGLYGVLPYIAPEILIQQAQQGLTRKIIFTQSTDIYSLGIIMTEISTGSRAFDGHDFEDLAINICMGLRPKFALGTPNCYIELANRCMDSDPQKRPTAIDITDKLYKWNRIIENSNIDEIKMQFLEADKFKPNSVMKMHPDHMYSSKPISTQKITESLLKLKVNDPIKSMVIPANY